MRKAESSGVILCSRFVASERNPIHDNAFSQYLPMQYLVVPRKSSSDNLCPLEPKSLSNPFHQLTHFRQSYSKD